MATVKNIEGIPAPMTAEESAALTAAGDMLNRVYEIVDALEADAYAGDLDRSEAFGRVLGTLDAYSERHGRAVGAYRSLSW